MMPEPLIPELPDPSCSAREWNAWLKAEIVRLHTQRREYLEETMGLRSRYSADCIRAGLPVPRPAALQMIADEMHFFDEQLVRAFGRLFRVEPVTVPIEQVDPARHRS